MRLWFKIKVMSGTAVSQKSDM